jgi:hypothetical protein
VAILLLGVSKHALAQCVGVGTSDVTCPAGPYPNGIGVAQPAAATTDFNVTLKSGVNVTGNNGVTIFNNSTQSTKTFVVMENGATINVTNAQGLAPLIFSGDATVTASGTISVQGTAQDAIELKDTFDGATAKIIYTGPSGGVVGTVPDITSSGFTEGTIIQAVIGNPDNPTSKGNAIVDASGNMLGFLNPGERFFQGLSATVNGDGNATALYHLGTITVE